MLPFVGPSYTLPTRQAAAQRTVNMYLQRVETPEKGQFILVQMPGFTQFADMADADGTPYQLLTYLKGEGDNLSTTFTDQVPGRTWGIGTGTPIISTSQYKFGASSIHSPGSSNISLTSSKADFVLSGDYTIEFWVYATGNAGAITPIYLYEACGPARDIQVTIAPFEADTSVRHTCGTKQIYSSDGADPRNRWIHVYAGKKGNTIYVGINGIVQSTSGLSETFVAPAYVFFNAMASTPGSGTWLDEVWILKGLCRYTTDFTPESPPKLP
jgi:Concanavalin A-like lectin/glucanases superfamily